MQSGGYNHRTGITIVNCFLKWNFLWNFLYVYIFIFKEWRQESFCFCPLKCLSLHHCGFWKRNCILLKKAWFFTSILEVLKTTAVSILHVKKISLVGFWKYFMFIVCFFSHYWVLVLVKIWLCRLRKWKEWSSAVFNTFNNKNHRYLLTYMAYIGHVMLSTCCA